MKLLALRGQVWGRREGFGLAAATTIKTGIQHYEEQVNFLRTGKDNKHFNTMFQVLEDLKLNYRKEY